MKKLSNTEAVLRKKALVIKKMYCISYIGVGKNLLANITKAFIGPPQNIKLSTARKIMKYGLSLIRIFLCLDKITGKCGYHFVHIRENTD